MSHSKTCLFGALLYWYLTWAWCLLSIRFCWFCSTFCFLCRSNWSPHKLDYSNQTGNNDLFIWFCCSFCLWCRQSLSRCFHRLFPCLSCLFAITFSFFFHPPEASLFSRQVKLFRLVQFGSYAARVQCFLDPQNCTRITGLESVWGPFLLDLGCFRQFYTGKKISPLNYHFFKAAIL